jgi:hypothetical protein
MAGLNQSLPQTFPLTPGWTCSPCTLMLTFYMLHVLAAGDRVVDSVNSYFEGNPQHDPPLRSHPLPAGGARIKRETILEHQFGDRPLRHPDYRANFSIDLLNHPVISTGDVNVSASGAGPPHPSGHERGFVRLYPPDRILSPNLADSSTPPYRGFLAAYNPATGEDYSLGRQDGQLYLFTSDGYLSQGNPAIYGGDPFLWRAVQGNQANFIFNNDQGAYSMKFAPDTTAPTMFLIAIFTFSLHEQSERYPPGGVYPPIAVASGTGQNDLFTRDGNAEDFWDMYAKRAVPFMTMEEFKAHSGYPLANALRPGVLAHGH